MELEMPGFSGAGFKIFSDVVDYKDYFPIPPTPWRQGGFPPLPKPQLPSCAELRVSTTRAEFKNGSDVAYFWSADGVAANQYLGAAVILDESAEGFTLNLYPVDVGTDQTAAVVSLVKALNPVPNDGQHPDKGFSTNGIRIRWVGIQLG
jgi:hypothetical protein